jgi:hypothetical protein
MIKLRFKYRPSEGDREVLMLNGFQYDPHTKTWTGKATEYNTLLAKTFKEESYGTVTLLVEL